MVSFIDYLKMNVDKTAITILRDCHITNKLCTPEPRFGQLSSHGATYRPGIVGT